MQVGTNPGMSCATSLGGGFHSEYLTGGRSSRLGRLYSCRVNDATSSMLGGRLFENHILLFLFQSREKGRKNLVEAVEASHFLLTIQLKSFATRL